MKLWEPNCMCGLHADQVGKLFRVDLAVPVFEHAASIGGLFGGRVFFDYDDIREPYEQPPGQWWLESLMDNPCGPVGKAGQCGMVCVRPCEIVLPGDASVGGEITLEVAAWFMQAELYEWGPVSRGDVPVVVEGVVALVGDEQPSGVWWLKAERPPFVPNR